MVVYFFRLSYVTGDFSLLSFNDHPHFDEWSMLNTPITSSPAFESQGFRVGLRTCLELLSLPLQQPGKLNLREFSNVTDAISKINLKEGVAKLTKHAPLATPESMDLGSEYATVSDRVPKQSLAVADASMPKLTFLSAACYYFLQTTQQWYSHSFTICLYSCSNELLLTKVLIYFTGKRCGSWSLFWRRL